MTGYAAPHIFDLSTADVPASTRAAVYSSGTLTTGTHPSWMEWLWADMVLDPAQSYSFEVDLDTAPSAPQLYIFGIKPTDPVQDAIDTSDFNTLAVVNGTGTAPQTLSLSMGPGLESWADAVAVDQLRPYFSLTAGNTVTAVRLTAGATVGAAVAGAPMRGYGWSWQIDMTADVDAPADPSMTLIPRRISSAATPEPTLVDGRPA